MKSTGGSVMIVSQLQVYNFRRFKSIDGKPVLSITFHEGLNALIGENDSGKTAIIDALKKDITAGKAVKVLLLFFTTGWLYMHHSSN